MADEFAPPKFFAYVRGMEHDQLFAEFNVRAARQVTLGAEVRMRAEYNIKEKRKLKSVTEERDILLKARDKEIESLKAQLLVKEAEAAEAIRLRAKAVKFESAEKSLRDEAATLVWKRRGVTAAKSQSDDLAGRVHELEASSAGLQEKVATYEDFIDQIEKFQDEQMEIVHEKFNKLDADFTETCLHLKEIFYPHLLTTIAGCRWLLTYDMKLAVLKCLNSLEALADVAAFNPSAEGDFISALQEVQNVNFSLLSELRRHGGASNVAIDTTTALSVTPASASTIPPISTNDYQVVHVDGQEGTVADVNPFPNVEDAELNVLE
ncbi:hypothetical protein Tco_0476191 [Tanacetum coccineum]